MGAVGVAAHQRDRAAVLFIEDERVVDGRVELDGERRLHVLDGLFDRAVELRHAADGQRALHAEATVALKHGAVLQNGADVGRGVDLVGVRAHGHQALVHSHQRTMWTSAGAAPSARPIARSTLSTCCRESRRPERSTKALRNSILAGRYPKSGRPAFFLLCARNGERKSAPWHLSKF